MGTRWLAVAVCLALGAGASLFLGQDANFDLLNYHLYNPFALVTGRAELDLAPAGFHSFINPLIDVPYYFLAAAWLPDWPRLVAAIQGLYFGLLLLVAFRINRRVFPADGEGSIAHWALPVLAVAIGASGAATVSEIGTTMGDIPVAVLALWGVLLLLPRGENADDTGRLMRDALGGVLIGAAVGLKLVAAIYAPAAFIAVLVAEGFRHRAWMRGASLAAGGVVGFVVTGGWWAWRMWRVTGSPAFPFFNGIFRSDWMPQANFQDTRFLPESLLQALFYPFYWALREESFVTEIIMRDPRLAVAFVAVIVLAIAWAWQVRRGAAPLLDPTLRFLLVFVVVSCVLWEGAFSILRYAVGLEVLGGTLTVAAISIVMRRLAARPVIDALAACGLLAAVVAWSSPFNWGRIPFGERVFAVEVPEVPPDSLLVLVGPTLSYVLPFIDAPRLRAIGSSILVGPQGTRIFAESARRIAAHDGPLFALLSVSETEHPDAALARRLGLAWDESACRPIASNLTTVQRICPAWRE